MRFVLILLLVFILSFAACHFFPWWSVVIASGLVGLMFSQKRRRKRFERKRKSNYSFLAGFIAVFILWAGMAFFLNQANDSYLSLRISQLIIPSEGEGNAILLIFASGILGGLLGGFGAMTGTYLGEALKS